MLLGPSKLGQAPSPLRNGSHADLQGRPKHAGLLFYFLS